MIKESGIDRIYLDLSEGPLPDGTDRICLVLGISVGHVKATGEPFIKFNLVDVNGQRISGFWWEHASARNQEFGWALNHLVVMSLSSGTSVDGLNVTGLRNLPAGYNEDEILKDKFISKISTIQSLKPMLENFYANLAKNSNLLSKVNAHLAMNGGYTKLAVSRNQRICDGMAGGRLCLVASVVYSLYSAYELYAFSRQDLQVAVYSELVYEYLCAVYEPANIADDNRWRITAVISFSNMTDSLFAGLEGNDLVVKEDFISSVLTLLGMTDADSKIGAVLKGLRKAMIEMSNLGYTIDNLAPGLTTKIGELYCYK